MKRILFLHGSNSRPGGTKAQFLERSGFEVVEPALTYATAMGAPPEPLEALTARWGPRLDRLIPENVDIVERCIRDNFPDAIVGSSRGASLAMNLRTRTLPMVLIAPAWRLRLPAVLRLLGASTPEQRAQVENMFPEGIWRAGAVETLPAHAVILHSLNDDLVPFADSEVLIENSRAAYDVDDLELEVNLQTRLMAAGYELRQRRIIPIGLDHRANDPDPKGVPHADPCPMRAMVCALNILLDAVPLPVRPDPDSPKTTPIWSLVATLQGCLTPDLLKPRFREANRSNPHHGHCYHASEALYHLIRILRLPDGFQLYRPFRGVDDQGISHWWLQTGAGQIIDPTADQYHSRGQQPPHSQGRPRAFLTQRPSRNAQRLIERVLRSLPEHSAPTEAYQPHTTP